MNDHRHLDDEALSAHLDGQLPEAEWTAADAHLATCERCPARRDALDQARGLLGGTDERLDDVSRRRLVSRALATTGSARARARPWRNPAVLGAAAVIALLVGVGVAVVGGDGGRDDMAALAPGALDPELFVGDLGDLDDDPEAIRRALRGGSSVQRSAAGAGAPAESEDEAAEAQEDAVTAEPTNGGGTGTVDGTATPDQGFDSAAQSATPAQGLSPTARGALLDDRAAAEACLAQATPDDASELLLAATGTFQGEAAVVLAYRTGSEGRVLALIVARSDCSILSAQSFR